MNINIVVKNFKKENGYTERGNFQAAKKLKSYIMEFKGFSEFVLPKNALNRDLIESIEVNVVDIDDINFRNFNPNDSDDINICLVQNPKHRTKFDEIIKAYDWYEPIIFDRGETPENYSNGLAFSKKFSKKFLPRYYADEYETLEKVVNKDRHHVGIYFRPDVCPLQNSNYINFLNGLYDKYKNTIHEKDLPVIVQYGKEVNLNYPYSIHTNEQHEFFGLIDTYCYSPMEIEDPMPNTLIEAMVNKKNIVILEPDVNYLGMASIDEIESYMQDLKPEERILNDAREIFGNDFEYFNSLSNMNFINNMDTSFDRVSFNDHESFLKKIEFFDLNPPNNKQVLFFRYQLFKKLISLTSFFFINTILTNYSKNYLYLDKNKLEELSYIMQSYLGFLHRFMLEVTESNQKVFYENLLLTLAANNLIFNFVDKNVSPYLDELIF